MSERGAGPADPTPTGTGTRRGRRARGANPFVLPPADDLVALAAAFERARAGDLRAGCEAVLAAWRAVRDRQLRAEGPLGSDGSEDAAGPGGAAGTGDGAAGDGAAGDGPAEPPPVTGAGRPVWAGWRRLLAGPDGPARAAAAARLDGWLALDEVVRDAPGALAAAGAATARLRAAGLESEALLHEQAVLLAAGRTGRVPAPAALASIERLVHRVAVASGAPGDLGLALSRVVLARELAAERGHGGGPAGDGGPLDAGPLDAGPDPLDAGLEALAEVPPDGLGHQERNAVCRLLRLRARDEPADQAAVSLRAAVGVLPDGVHPLERALAAADLAGVLAGTDPPAALAAWDAAVADAATVPAGDVLGGLLAARGSLRHAVGDVAAALDDLGAALPLLDGRGGPLAAQARLDLCRALLDAGRPDEARAAAETGLALVTDLLHRVAGPAAPTDAGDRYRAEVHLAGCLAYAAAQAAIRTTIRTTGQAAVGGPGPGDARDLAVLAADWHAVNGNLLAQSEAWELAAGAPGPPGHASADLDRAAALAEGAGDWHRAANCRRRRVAAALTDDGPAAALAALAEVDAGLERWERALAGRHAAPADEERAAALLRWHRLGAAEERARLLAVGGRYAEAMAAVEGLAERYEDLGDRWSARDLLGLRGQLRAELGDVEGALGDLRRAAGEAVAAGDRAQAEGLADRLAAVLARAGREAEAEAEWTRYAG